MADDANDADTPNPQNPFARPHPDRVIDYLLDGGLNTTLDRRAAHQVLNTVPDAATALRAHRDTKQHAITTLLDTGFRQILDLGSGLPTAGRAHDLAIHHCPSAAIVYLDHDPIIVQHATRVLDDLPIVNAVHADPTSVEAVLSTPLVTTTLDLTQPLAVLGFHTFRAQPEESLIDLAYRYAHHLAPGSVLTFAQPTTNSPVLATLNAIAEATSHPLTPPSGADPATIAELSARADTIHHTDHNIIIFTVHNKK